MSSNVHITAAIRNVRVDAVGDLCDAGFIDIYDGTQPANAATAITSQVKIVRLTFNAAAFAAASAGSATAGAITSGVALASGSPTWARWLKTDGTTGILDCSVGVSAGSPDIVIPGASISSGTTVSMSSLTISEAA